MKNQVRKLVLFLSAVVMLTAVMCFGVSAAETTGQCGDNVYWNFNEATGELVISGEGDMWDWESSSFSFWSLYPEKLVIENGVTSIGAHAFDECDYLTEIVIPDGVTYIGDEAFYGCAALKHVTIPDSVTDLGFGVFVYSGIESVTIGSGMETIEDGTFALCSKLKEVTVPDSVINIGPEAFEACVSLDSVTIPAGVKKIDTLAFYMSHYIEEFTVKSMDAEIGDLAFGLAELTWPGMSREEITEMFWYVWTAPIIKENHEIINDYVEKYNNAEVFDEPVPVGTVYCHEGSTTEAYCEANGIKPVLVHFYEGEWVYDYDKMIRTRKCIHCDELETEKLETATDENVEVIVPENSDTDVEVDEIEKNSSDYILVENIVSDTVEGSFIIHKAFDINLKNKDGVHVQPDGTVKVKLPLDWEKDGDYKVYRVNSDGTLTDMNAYRQGSHMVFDTDHFSVYIIVEENVQQETPVTPDEEENENFFIRFINSLIDFVKMIISVFKK